MSLRDLPQFASNEDPKKSGIQQIKIMPGLLSPSGQSPGAPAPAARASKNPGYKALSERLAQRKSLTEIGKEYGVSAPAVLKWLRSLDLEPAGRTGRPPTIDIEKLRELALKSTELKGSFKRRPDNTMTWKEIGKELGVSTSAAYQMAQRLGLIPENTGRETPLPGSRKSPVETDE